MKNFFQSFLPIIKRLKKYKIEIFLLFAALIIALISMIIYFKTSQPDEEIIVDSQPQKILSQKIFVDVSGAVEKPGVYQATVGARLKDVLLITGGLSAEADRNFFARNFNLARIVADQEKIYIPSTWEISNGLFTESSRSLEYYSPSSSFYAETKTNINAATLDELDRLPGIGKITAAKIIQGQPYQTIEELLTKKIVNKSVYENIKTIITTY